MYNIVKKCCRENCTIRVCRQWRSIDVCSSKNSWVTGQEDPDTYTPHGTAVPSRHPRHVSFNLKMNRTISKYLLAILVFNLVSIHGLRSQDDQNNSDWRSIDSQVRELINGKEFNGFNGSVLIGKNGEYLVQQSFGWTNMNRLEEITKVQGL